MQPPPLAAAAAADSSVTRRLLKWICHSSVRQCRPAWSSRNEAVTATCKHEKTSPALKFWASADLRVCELILQALFSHHPRHCLQMSYQLINNATLYLCMYLHTHNVQCTRVGRDGSMLNQTDAPPPPTDHAAGYTPDLTAHGIALINPYNALVLVLTYRRPSISC